MNCNNWKFFTTKIKSFCLYRGKFKILKREPLFSSDGRGNKYTKNSIEEFHIAMLIKLIEHWVHLLSDWKYRSFPIQVH